MRSIRSGWFSAAALVLIMWTVSACVPPTLRELAQGAGATLEATTAIVNPVHRSSGDALIDFLAEAEEGEARELDDPVTGARLQVRAGRVYHAASGRLCRRYTAVSEATPGNGGRGLACEGTNGYWARARLLAPVLP